MEALALIQRGITYAVVAAIVGVIILMLLRLVMNYADVNPFGALAMAVRRYSDPLIVPVRRALAGFGVDGKIAPLITILLTILVGYFVIRLSGTTLGTLLGVLMSGRDGRFVALIGHLLYGALSIYELLIIMRIIFSWGMAGSRNRVMRFLVRATDPVLVPLRRMIPPFGPLDLSPIFAFILIWLFQQAIAGTLLGV